MKRLKQLFQISLFILCSFGLSSAELLDVNSSLGYTIIYLGNQGSTDYDPGTDLLSIYSDPVYLRESASHHPRIIFPTGDPLFEGVTINVAVDETGSLVGGVSGDDLVVSGEVDMDGDEIVDFAGILLTGEVSEFGFADSGGPTDNFDFRFTVTGGLLASRYLNRDVGIYIASESSNFTGSFAESFTGEAKGKLGALPMNCTGSIGDFIWRDIDRDGIQDAGEPGIEGVTVILEEGDGTVLGTTTTGIDGVYLFTGLCAGEYRVVVDEGTLPPGYVATPENQGGDDTVDNDGSPCTVNLPANDADDPTVDFGFNYPCTGIIGDRIWHDVDRDGIQDAGEPGLGMIEVKLKDSEGLVIALDTTDENGIYRFEGLCAGDYTVAVNEQTLPPEYLPTPKDQGEDDTVDNDGSPVDVTLPEDMTCDLTIDFGYNSPCAGSIGDFVWHDVDRDGIQDAGEPGIDGVRVYLRDGSDMLIAMTTTSSNGAYAFNGLCAGDYTVEVEPTTLPTDFVPTPADQGEDDTADSDPSPVSVTLTDDITHDPTLDFGYSSPCTGSIGDFVWHDLTRDGIQDVGEPGLDNVKVILKDDAGNEVAVTHTGAGGEYAFTGLCEGTYRVDVDETTLAPGFEPTVPGAGADDEVDSDGPLNGGYLLVTLTMDESTDTTIDFGYVSPCEGFIGDLVWHDLDRDAIQDAGEPGIDGVRVILKDSSGTIIAESRTEQGGLYSFTGLCDDDYTVDVDETTLPAGFTPTGENLGGDDELDSDGPAAGGAVPATPADGLSIDFGYLSECEGFIGDFIWYDENRDGIQGADETGLAGIRVILKDAEGRVKAETTSDSNGFYLFAGLCAGEYKVAVDESTLPSGFEPSPCNVAGVDDEKDSDCIPVPVTLTRDRSFDRNIDFGYMTEACAECEGKVTELTLRYDGTKTEWVEVMQKKEGRIFEEELSPGETFTIIGVDKKGTLGTEISIHVGGALDTAIHTSCSNPIGPGLVSGDFTVIKGFSREGGKLCPVNVTPPDDACGCEGKVTELTLRYDGTKTEWVEVMQKKEGSIFEEELSPGETFTITGVDKKGTLGTEISIHVGGALDTAIHTSCSRPIGPGLVSGDFTVIEGFSREGGKLCPVNVTPPDDACGCEGKVTELTLRYDGTKTEWVEVIQKKEGSIFEEELSPGETFIITGVDKKGTLGTEISIHVGAALDTAIHTSCSRPIGPGLVSGDFTVIEGFSREGGELCPL